MKRQEEHENKLKENEQFSLSLVPFHLKITNGDNTLFLFCFVSFFFTSTEFQ